MAYRVELAKSAEAQLEELYSWVIDRAPNQGAAWFNGFEKAILSLEQFSKRCRIAAERFDPNQAVRVLNCGRSPHVYHLFFAVDDAAKVVRVVHIRRAARQTVAPADQKVSSRAIVSGVR